MTEVESDQRLLPFLPVRRVGILDQMPRATPDAMVNCWSRSIIIVWEHATVHFFFVPRRFLGYVKLSF